MVGKIEKLGLRDVWQHEASDFTTWLADNMDVLNDAIGLELSCTDREKSTGSFYVDIVAEDMGGRIVVVENQLERSNHDHLGKLITYLASLAAMAAVWIVADTKPEHVQAVAWLNESASASFYLVKVEAVKIGESEPAALLTLIVGPSEEGRLVGKKKKEIKERHILREHFWTQLLESAKQKTSLHSGISPSTYSWISTSAGKRGLSYNYGVRQQDAKVELYIDLGKEQDEQNLSIYDQLFKVKENINQAFGEPLLWERLDEKRACRISKVIEVCGYRDDEKKWPGAHDALIDAMIRLEKALKPHIKKLMV